MYESTDFEYLTELLENEEESDKIRIWAIKNLLWIHKYLALKPYFKHLNSKKINIRQAIIENLGELINSIPAEKRLDEYLSAEDIFPYFNEKNPTLRELAFRIAFHLKSIKIEPILNLMEEDESPEIRSIAVKSIPLYYGKLRVIPHLNDSNEKVILDALKQATDYDVSIPTTIQQKLKNHLSLEIRVAYAKFLRKWVKKHPYDDFALNQILQYFNDSFPFFQALAINTFTEIGKEEMVEYLEPKLNQLNDEQVIIESLKAISKFHAFTLKAAVIRLLDDPRRIIRQQAIETFDVIANYEEFEIIIVKIKDNFFEIRMSVYNILEKRLDPRCILPLIDNLLKTPVNEWSVITAILDRFSDNQVLIPLLSKYRTISLSHIDYYFEERFHEKFENFPSVRALKNISIHYLIAHLHDPNLANTPYIILKAWGNHAYSQLTQYREKLQNDKENAIEEEQKSQISEFIAQTEQLIEEIQEENKINIRSGYSLIL